VAGGWDDCDLTGYKGRVGVYELVLDEPIRNAIRDGQGRGHSFAGERRRNAADA
jgi:type II secretory ATPase GspE/PulE/Tfp pilus assembly ATPase PilB-like protein